MSKRVLPVRIILALVLAGVLGCTLAPTSPAPGGSPMSSLGGGSPSPQPSPSPSPSLSATPTPRPTPTIDPLEAAVSRSLEAMSDNEKVG